jgi:hypothetical protein
VAHPRTAILAGFKTALSGVGMQPTIFTHVALPVPFDDLPAISIAPGEETAEADTHDDGIPSVPTFRVNVTCSATTQEDADELAFQVQQAAPYTTVGIGARYAGSAFASDGDGEKLVFQTQLHFDVRYEVSVS